MSRAVLSFRVTSRHTLGMDQERPKIEGARARARADITAAIIAEGRRQLAEHGAEALSLRSVARSLGMVSSAVYRYVEHRDALLTHLIIAAYDELGAEVEASVTASRRRLPARRWVDAAETIRTWALEHPHDYALLYGTPVRDYRAPVDTVGPATRSTLALMSIVDDARRDGRLHPVEPPIDLSRTLRGDARTVAELLGNELDAETVLRVVTAWSQLFGLVSFELFGQTANVVTDDADLFRTTAVAMAGFIGLDG